MSFDNDKFGDSQTHPAYGMISFNRISGGNGKFFGSHMNVKNYIELNIKQAEVSHDLGRNWFYGRNNLITVKITHNQFVELITSMNTKETPCTITRLNHEEVEAMPVQEKTEAQKAVFAFKDRMKNFSSTLDKYRNKTNELLNKPRLNKKDVNELKSMMEQSFQEIDSNIGFYIDSFDKSASKIVTEAKQEVEAFTSDIIRNAGLEAISKGDFPKLIKD